MIRAGALFTRRPSMITSVGSEERHEIPPRRRCRQVSRNRPGNMTNRERPRWRGAGYSRQSSMSSSVALRATLAALTCSATTRARWPPLEAAMRGVDVFYVGQGRHINILVCTGTLESPYDSQVHVGSVRFYLSYLPPPLTETANSQVRAKV